jgi:hypothetical protein
MRTNNLNLFINKFNELFIITTIKKRELSSIIQYSLLYLVLVGSFGYIIDRLFPIYNEQKKKIYIFLEISIQIIFSALAIYFIRGFVNIIPLVYQGIYTNKKQVGYQGDIIISLILLSVQRNLADKMYFLARNTEPMIVKDVVKKTKDTTDKVVKDVKDVVKKTKDTTDKVVKDVKNTTDKLIIK